MGTGIAQLAAQSGARTLLLDPDASALARATARLDELAGRGKIAPDARARIEPVDGVAALAPCELVIEAAPEDLELKRTLLAGLAEHVGTGCVLATNTSSLSVTAIAAAVPHPERVVGMHFFNPRAADGARGDRRRRAVRRRRRSSAPAASPRRWTGA